MPKLCRCIFLVTVTATPLFAAPPSGDIRPISVETITPLPVVAASATASKAKQPPSHSSEEAEERSFRKAKIAMDPDVQVADVVVPMNSKALVATTAAATVTTSFAGLDKPSSGSVVRPDTIFGKSGFRGLEAVNSALRLFLNGGGVVATKSLNDFFGATGTDKLFDPRVFFDRNGGANLRFYVVAVQKNDAAQTSSLFLAVSRVSNPPDLEPANWCRYQINAVRNAGTASVSWADYPTLGVGTDAVVVADNQFRFLGSPQTFIYSLVRVFNKATLSDNTISCPPLTSWLFRPSAANDDFDTETIQPVQHYSNPSSFPGTTNPTYLVNSVNPPSSSYRVWRVRNVASGSPTLQFTTVTGNFQYDDPPDAPQLGGSPLDTFDARVTQAAGMGNTLWVAQSTACAIGGGGNEACARVLRLDVNQTMAGALEATISQQLTFGGGDGVFYWMPSIAVSSAHDTAIAFLTSSATSYLSTAWTSKAAAASYSSVQVLGPAGDCAIPPSALRRGDYVGAQTEPTDLLGFWLAGERAASISGLCQWATSIVKVTLGG